MNRKNIEYPPEEKIVYSPSVHICRTPEYKWKRKFVEVSCIAAAAIRRPRIKYNSEGEEFFSNYEDKEFMRNTLRQIFEIAKNKKHDSIVLGAWGCGAFGGPRDGMVEIFEEVILEKGDEFAKIGFGVLVKSGSDDENFVKFKKIVSPDKK